MSLQSNNNLIGIPTKRYNKSSNYTNILSTLPRVRIDRNLGQIRGRCGFDTRFASSMTRIRVGITESWITSTTRGRGSRRQLQIYNLSNIYGVGIRVDFAGSNLAPTSRDRVSRRPCESSASTTEGVPPSTAGCAGSVADRRMTSLSA